MKIGEMLAFAAAATLVAVLVTSGGGCGSYSDGDRAGAVSKLSRKGIVCKTWEGELVLGGISATPSSDGTTTFGSNVWKFTVKDGDEQSLKILQEASETGERVKVTYSQVFIKNPCRSETGYFVEKVTKAGSRPTAKPGT